MINTTKCTSNTYGRYKRLAEAKHACLNDPRCRAVSMAFCNIYIDGKLSNYVLCLEGAAYEYSFSDCVLEKQLGKYEILSENPFILFCEKRGILFPLKPANHVILFFRFKI